MGQKKVKPEKVIVRSGKRIGQEFPFYQIATGRRPEVPEGMIVVKNPKYDPEAAEEFYFFKPGEVEIVYPEMNTTPYFQRQLQRQEESGTHPQ